MPIVERRTPPGCRGDMYSASLEGESLVGRSLLPLPPRREAGWGREAQGQTTYWMGENVCKWCDRKWVNIQNIQLNIKKKTLILKWTEDLNDFPKTYRWPNRCMKWYTVLLSIREMQVKTMMRYHITSKRITIIKKKKKNSFDKNVKKSEYHSWLVRMKKMMQPL